MDRGEAYRLLSAELEQVRQLGHEAPVSMVGQPPAQKVVRLGQEDVTFELPVLWADAKTRTIRIEAAAFGSNWWLTERLTESATIHPPAATPSADESREATSLQSRESERSRCKR
jgi:hypothetical protein